VGPGATLDLSAGDERAALRAVFSAYFASRQFAGLGGAYVEQSVIPGALLWVHAWRPLPGFVAWVAVLAWGAFAALAVSFGLLASRARRKLMDALPRVREAAHLHFAPAPPPPVSLLLVHALVPLSGILWVHALGSDLLPPAVLSLAARCWLVVVGLWLAVRWSEQPV
jgi:hypothetical protein